MNGMCQGLAMTHNGKFGEVQVQCISPDELAYTAIAPKSSGSPKQWLISSVIISNGGWLGALLPVTLWDSG